VLVGEVVSIVAGTVHKVLTGVTWLGIVVDLSLGFRQDRYIGTTIDGGLRGHHLSSIGAVALYRDDFSTKPPFGCFVGLQGVGTGKSALNVDAEGRGPR
jgi:hypothetical protein